MHSRFLTSLAALLTLAAVSACGNRGPDLPARGSASITWTVITLGRPTSCTQVGATSVSLQLHPRSGADVVTTFPCAAMRGTATAVHAGAYDATLTLVGADGALIAAAPPQRAVTIGADQVVELAAFAFDVPPRGTLVLSLVALTAPANCQPRDQGGAGITTIQVSLEHAGDGCATVTFTRSRGGIATGMYTVDCRAPALMRCLERDELLAVDGIDAGPYALFVEADVGPSPCWMGHDVLLVPGGGTLTKPIQLAPQSVSGC